MEKGDDSGSLFIRADEALYLVKKNWRNRAEMSVEKDGPAVLVTLMDVVLRDRVVIVQDKF